jgi:phosphotransferase system HPr-like phosphotransfer protein
MKVYKIIVQTSKEKPTLYPQHCAKLVNIMHSKNILEAKISIVGEKQKVDMKSILGLISLSPRAGAELEITYAVEDNISEKTITKMTELLKLGEIKLVTNIVVE